MTTRVVIRSLDATPGWVPLLRALGYSVKHRPAQFGRTEYVLRKAGDVATITQGGSTALSAEVPATVAADLRTVGVAADAPNVQRGKRPA